eukprot:5071876-Pleurochrysis_carterae.AAC.1
MHVHCCHKPGLSQHARLAGAVSSDIEIKPEVIWNAGQESPRLRIDIVSAVEFVNATLVDSAVGTCRSRANLQAVVRCACGHVARAFAHRTSGGLHRARVATLLSASRKYLVQRCAKRLGALLTRRDGQKGVEGARGCGLVVQLRS